MAADTDAVQRIAGDDRYETAAAIAKAKYNTADNVVIANSKVYADAINASLLAKHLGAPILLTEVDNLSAATERAIADASDKYYLGTKKAYIVGGTAVVSQAVEDRLVLKLGKDNVTRIAGDDRNKTAAAIAEMASAASFGFIVAWNDDKNALAAGAVAVRDSAPILLVQSGTGVAGATEQAIKEAKLSTLYVLGDATGVTDAQIAVLQGFDGVTSVERLDDALAIAAKFFADATSVTIANAASLVDALGGSVFAQPIVYVDSDSIPSDVEAYLNGKQAANVLGGAAAISDDVLNLVGNIVGGDTEGLVVESVSAINAKTLKAVFNKAVEDTTKATFEVKKGTVKVNTSAITWNEAKTEASLELSGKLTAGEYTVNVTGLAEAALTGTVTAENERVETITITADTAPFANTTTGSKTVTVGYKVVNQYGEDITNTTQLLPTAAGVAVDTARGVTYSKGVVTIPVTDTAKENDQITLTLVQVDSGKSASGTIKVGASATVAEVAINSLYNKDNKTLTETTDLNRDAFYLLIEGKDQYGNSLKANQITGLVANSTNTLIAQINGGNNPVIDAITVAGKEVPAIKIVGPVTTGSTTVMLIAPTTGNNASFKIDVAESQRADTVTFEVPDLVAAGEDLYVPIVVTDKAGNVITDVDTLKNATRGVQISGLTGVTNNNIETKDGKTVVKVGSGLLTQPGYIALVAVSSTAKTTTANIQVKAAAEATIVTGLKAGNATTLLPNGATTISVNSLSVEDQYGRIMSPTALTTWLSVAGNQIIVKDAATDIVKLDKGTFVVATNVFTTGGTVENKPTGEAIDASTNAVQVVGFVKGTEKVSVTLKKTAGEIATSAKEISFQVTDGSEYASYQMDPIGPIFDEVGAVLTNDALYDKTLKVYGVLANGTKVELTAGTDYTVDAPAYLDYSAGKLTKNTGTVPYAPNTNEVKATVTITVNATGQQFKEEITVSKVKPTVTALKIVPQATATVANTSAAFDNAKEVVEYDSNAFAATAINTLVNFVVKDSYGVVQLLDTGADGKLGADVKLVATPAVANTIEFTKQNAHDTTFAGLEKGEKFTVTATIGGVSKTFTVTGTLDTVDYVSKAKAAVEAATATVAADLAVATTGADEATAKSNIKTAVDAVTFTPTGGAAQDLPTHGVISELVDVTFTAAVGGTSDGSIKFKVKLTKGNATATTSEFTATITK